MKIFGGECFTWGKAVDMPATALSPANTTTGC